MRPKLSMASDGRFSNGFKKKWLCRPVEFKKGPCRRVEFKRRPCRPVEFKKVPYRLSLRAKNGRVAVSILKGGFHVAIKLGKY